MATDVNTQIAQQLFNALIKVRFNTVSLLKDILEENGAHMSVAKPTQEDYFLLVSKRNQQQDYVAHVKLEDEDTSNATEAIIFQTSSDTYLDANDLSVEELLLVVMQLEHKPAP